VLFPCSGDLEQIPMLAKALAAKSADSGDRRALREIIPVNENRSNS
jgi:hypothetical protein